MPTFVAPKILSGGPPGPHIGAQELQGRELPRPPAAPTGPAAPEAEGGLEPSACLAAAARCCAHSA